MKALIIILGLGFFTPLAFAGAIEGRHLLSGETTKVVPGKKGTVLVFLSAKCPCSNSHVDILKKLVTDFPDFSFVGAHANADEDPAVSKPYFRDAGFLFPVLEDTDGKLADTYKALKTPHAYVLDPEGKVLYRGGVTSSVVGPTADRQYLREALEDVQAGRTLRTAEGRTLGCMITRGKHAD